MKDIHERLDDLESDLREAHAVIARVRELCDEREAQTRTRRPEWDDDKTIGIATLVSISDIRAALDAMREKAAADEAAGFPAGPQDDLDDLAARLHAANVTPDPDCFNCDGVGCMDCRCRVVHDQCVNDCPMCCSPEQD